jgi:hypothetical protein
MIMTMSTNILMNIPMSTATSITIITAVCMRSSIS